MRKYSSNNFHKHTFCLWKEVSQTDFELQQPQFKSKSGSEYFFTEAGVYRISNHWGRAANCRWRLLPLTHYKNQHIKIGFARWTDFYPNDETANLFFIQVDFEQKTIDFFHKDMPFYDGKAFLRNASETAKTIKIIKQILNEEDWAKYLEYEDLESLRRGVIEKFINSNLSLNEIKREYN
ncbi:hypothetical protein EQG68_07100 [Flavobacterium piscinae]|uniref:DUF402 domain-containing protein n=1 Tax=Flavobacterium piscinae TaxID=2506424 RepID=A0A4V1N4L5_9FLAO|nr:hypothetical protein [Flavobacterium piscinae]RXR32586.1 hypothetical protein EQG68_07100 [Flavobacterium piscinae]